MNTMTSHQELLHLGSIARKWISLMSVGDCSNARRLLSADCGLIGFEVAEFSSVFIPVRTLHDLPNLEVRCMFGQEDTIVLYCNLTQQFGSKSSIVYRAFFRFRYGQITKIHLGPLRERISSEVEQPQHELPLSLSTLNGLW